MDRLHRRIIWHDRNRRERYNTGHDALYETKDGSKVLVYTSYRQGRGKSIAFLPDDIETVDDAREYIFLQEQEFLVVCSRAREFPEKPREGVRTPLPPQPGFITGNKKEEGNMPI